MNLRLTFTLAISFVVALANLLYSHPAFAQAASAPIVIDVLTEQEQQLFTSRAQHFYSLLEIPSPYDTMAGEAIARAHATLGKAYCEGLKNDIPMQAHLNMFNDRVERGDNRMALSGVIILAAGIEAYCPEFVPEFIAAFPQ
jgi:hypothetical protein